MSAPIRINAEFIIVSWGLNPDHTAEVIFGLEKRPRPPLHHPYSFLLNMVLSCPFPLTLPPH